jgi:hypothetical protein
LCYFQQTNVLANKIPPTQTWAIVEMTCDAFSLVVKAYVINSAMGIGHYWMPLL